MSLRLLLTLMAIVSAAMVYAVLDRKVIHRSPFVDPTVSEMRILKRVCENKCGDLAPEILPKAKNDAELVSLVNACQDECMQRHLQNSKPMPRWY